MRDRCASTVFGLIARAVATALFVAPAAASVATRTSVGVSPSPSPRLTVVYASAGCAAPQGNTRCSVVRAVPTVRRSTEDTDDRNHAAPHRRRCAHDTRGRADHAGHRRPGRAALPTVRPA